MAIAIKYLLANDLSGKYRWWTTEMGMLGQFEHASSLDDIRSQASAAIILIDAEDEHQG